MTQEEIQALNEEVDDLHWINRAIRKQLQTNQNRLNEIDKILAKEKEKENG